MRILRTSAALAAAGMVGLVFSAVAPTAASATPTSPAVLASPARPLANARSTGQAGYEITTAPAKSSSAGSFTVPTVTGCKVGHDSGIAAASLIFTGSGTTASVSGVGVFIQCTGGAPAFLAVAVVNGAGTGLSVTVAPGDAVSTSVSVTATKTTVTFKDTTKHFTKTLTGTGAVPAIVLDGIDTLVSNSTGLQLPVPKFATITFTKGKMDGKTPKLAGAIAVDLVTATTPVKIRILTGALSATGDSWTETFKHV